MRLSLHSKIREEVRAAMEHYRRAVGAPLADEFYRELRQLILRAANDPAHLPRVNVACAVSI